MPKLNQIVAVEKGLKSRSQVVITEVHHTFKKVALFAGISRIYTPVADDGEKLAPESTKVQKDVEEQLQVAAEQLTGLFDVVATKEYGNREATADVVVDAETILFGVPITYLLFLEKQLIDLRTLVGGLPVLDESEEWVYDEAVGMHRTPVTTTRRALKVPKVLVKYPATDKHPAQTEMVNEDVLAGTWATTRLSGAVTLKRRQQLVHRVDALADAVKKAREEANSIDVPQVKTGDAVFGYLLA